MRSSRGRELSKALLLPRSSVTLCVSSTYSDRNLCDYVGPTQTTQGDLSLSSSLLTYAKVLSWKPQDLKIEDMVPCCFLFFFFTRTILLVFLVIMTKTCKDDLRWERFIGAHSLREQSHMAWVVRWQTQEVASHTVSAVGKQRKLIPWPHWLFPFYSVRVPSTMVPPTFRVSCPSSVNSFWKHSHIDTCFHRVCNPLDNEG